MAGVLVLLAQGVARAGESWSRFRGPNGSGVAPAATGLPVEFGPDSGVLWKSDLPFARSSPVLTEDLIFLTAQKGDELLTYGLERDGGGLRWRATLQRSRKPEMYQGTDSASSTAVTDGTNVYCFFHEFGLVSYDEEGAERWRLELGPYHSFYGVSASPVLAGDVLVMVCDQVGPSFVVGVDRNSGEELWRTDRLVVAESWATPVLHGAADGTQEVLVFGTFAVHAYDTATGAERWVREGLGYNPISSPVLAGDRLLVSAAPHGDGPMPFSQLLAGDKDNDGKLSREENRDTPFAEHFGWIDPDGDGFAEREEWDAIMQHASTRNFGTVSVDLAEEPGESAEEMASWRHKRNVPEISSPLVYDGVVYLVAHGGILTLLDADSGEVLARERIAGAPGEVFASPVAGDGKVYVASTPGTVAVLKAGRTYELLAINDLGEDIRATPAISDGCLYIRTATALYCFGL